MDHVLNSVRLHNESHAAIMQQPLLGGRGDVDVYQTEHKPPVSQPADANIGAYHTPAAGQLGCYRT